jgi:hypothetical protein
MQEYPKRTIESILDLKTGKEIVSSVFFDRTDDKIFKSRHDFEKCINQNKKRYVCYECRQYIKIRGGKSDKIRWHFAHLRDSDDCSIKTNTKYSKKEINSMKYNGARESELHFNLKHLIATYLLENQKNTGKVSKVEIEKVTKNENTWKRPDISFIFKNFSLVIELQLSTTFLSVIVDRQLFHRGNNTFVLWVFNHFSTNDRRKFTQSDVFYSNNQNAFVFDKDAQKLSESNQKLMLCCYYREPLRDGHEICHEWRHKYVNLDDLTFNPDTCMVYYFDVEGEEVKMQQEIDIEDESYFINIIKTGTLENLIEEFEYDNLTKNEFEYVKKLYNQEIRPVTKIERDSWKVLIVWAIMLYRLKNEGLIKEFVSNKPLKKVLIDLASLKTNKILGYDFQRQIQIAHKLLDKYPEYMHYYKKAVSVYGNIGKDKDGKLERKFSKIEMNKNAQEENNKVIELLFPELNV